MAFDYDTLIDYRITTHQQVTPKDVMLYALGVGLGASPVDPRELAFVYERDLVPLPTMATVIASPGMWPMREDLDIDWKKVLHGEEGLRLHKPLAVEGRYVGEMRITDIIDKGAGKGALIYQERKLYDEASGDHVATLTKTWMARGDGGCGGPAKPTPRPHAVPDRAPDAALERATLPQAALIYRLSGDDNPIHADPEVAAAGGFERPILHGLCTYGVAGYALLALCCDQAPDRLRAMDARFTSPVYPGETIRTEVWRDGAIAAFRCTAVERNQVVIDNGRAEIAA